MNAIEMNGKHKCECISKTTNLNFIAYTYRQILELTSSWYPFINNIHSIHSLFVYIYTYFSINSINNASTQIRGRIASGYRGVVTIATLCMMDDFLEVPNKRSRVS